MEAGFGWHYPPGTPGARMVAVTLRCTNPDCGWSMDGHAEHELGMTSLTGELEDHADECPDCGSPVQQEEGDDDYYDGED